MKKSLSIHLCCSEFPGNQFCGRGPIFVGIQKKQEVEELTPGDAQEKIFKLSVQVNADKQGEPNFLGPYVFGKTGDKFLYLVWLYVFQGEQHRFRRAKIKLNHLRWEAIEAAIASQQALIAHIRMTDQKSGPVCASLKGTQIRWA
ncbi:MAG: DUF5990 family protein [Bacteroidota bacterium]